MRVLILEDEEKLSQAISEGLVADGYDVAVANDGETGLQQLRTHGFDLAVVDVMLPRKSGLEVLKDIRQSGVRTPVLILTSLTSIEDRVSGLDSGADDYLVKPFAFAELLARIRVLLRRGISPESESPRKLSIADLEIDLQRRTATRAGCTLDLTVKEFSLLEYLLAQGGKVVSREMLARDVWMITSRLTPLDNVIDVQVARLRRKLDDPFPRKLLHTVRGVGFAMREEAV